MEIETGPRLVSEVHTDFDTCFRELFPRVARTAALVCRDRQLGPDIAQEAFARLYERWDQMDSADHARNFVFRVAVNLARSELRRRVAAPFGLRAPDQISPDHAGPTAAWRDIMEALGSLSPMQRVAAAIAVGTIAIGWSLLPRGRSEGPAGPPTPSGTIAYATHEADTDLFTASTFEFGQYAPVGRVQNAAFPRWSPDGGTLAFLDMKGGDWPGLAFVGPDGLPSTPLIEEGVRDFAWAPDGRSLAAVVNGVDGQRTIVQVTLDGQRTTLPIPPGEWNSVSWSPDGTTLALSGYPRAEAERAEVDIFLASLDGNLQRLPGPGLVEFFPEWSPDGTTLAFVGGQVQDDVDPLSDIYVMRADGSGRTRITDHPGYDGLPVWSPDGRWLLFASDRDASPEQQALNRKGKDFGGVGLFAMAPDGSAVYKVLDSYDGEVRFPGDWRY